MKQLAIVAVFSLLAFGTWEQIKNAFSNKAEIENVELRAQVKADEIKIQQMNDYLTFEDEDFEVQAMTKILLDGRRPESLSEAQRIFTKNIALMIIKSYDEKIELTFGQARRSLEEQRRLRSEGKSLTLNSHHLDALAVDFNFFVYNGDRWILTYHWGTIKPMGDYWETLNECNRWGGDWNKNDRKDGWLDVPHFEMQKSCALAK